ncbi:MAG: hypothetical protein HYX28_06455 [Candidatus Koribacter versatilis]|uniref:Uncharacterized protein n=1 Tax=Candidatus Korobacter versatilis TaxID=658062 RepID=A0A932EPQ5_9BACT|nr:hypothetical protein [Candidatus Koribacter versatilis]
MPSSPARRTLRIDEWPHERVGYEHKRPTAAYAAAGSTTVIQRTRFHRAWVEERVGSLTAAGAMFWAAYTIARTGGLRLDSLLHTPGPIEVAAVGILVWLHAKWLRSTRA